MIWFGGVRPSLDALNQLETDTLAATMGIRFDAVTDDTLSASMPVRKGNMQPYGILHGGASVVLIETLGSVAAAFTVDPKLCRVVGLEVNANHIRPATRGEVHGEARPLHIGRRTEVWAVDIRDDAARLTASGRITIAVIDGDF